MKKRFKREIIDVLRDKDSVNRFNRLMSSRFVIAPLVVAMHLFFFFVANYIMNTAVKIPNLKENFSLLGETLSWKNFFSFGTIPWYLYAALNLIILFLDIRLVFRIRTAYKDYNVGQKGNERFATLQEIEEQYKEIPESGREYAGKGGIPVGWYGNKVYIDDSPVNNYIIGITRSGKTERFIWPAIDSYSRAEQKPSLIIGDPKLELASAAYETLKKRGYEVHTLNLIEPELSMGYNPLQLVIEKYKDKEYSKAELLCRTLCFSLFSGDTTGNGDTFFRDNATALLSALIMAHVHDALEKAEKKKDSKYEKQINMYSICCTFIKLASDFVDETETKTRLDEYFRNRGNRDRARMLYAAIEISGDRPKASIYSTMLKQLQVFLYEEVAKMTAISTFDLKKVGFGDKPVAIFLGIPDHDQSNHFLASVFIRQLYFVLAEKCSKSASGKCDREVVFLLDEFGNLPAIEGLANIMTVCLGRNIRFNLVVQSDAQVDKLYGKDKDTIVGNCGNQIYILTSDEKTAKRFSSLLGKYTIYNLSRAGKKYSLNKSYTEMYDQKPLLSESELMSLKEGECVIHRVIKRKDLKGHDITSYPIYNCGSSCFKARYEYMLDDFPSGHSLRDYPVERTDHIQLDDIVFEVDSTAGTNQYSVDQIGGMPPGENKTFLLTMLPQLLQQPVESVEQYSKDDLTDILAGEFGRQSISNELYQRLLESLHT